MQNETMPKMFGAFRTTASSGGDKPSYEMVFKFSSMADMHAADDEWIAFRRAREALATPTRAENAQVRGEDISEIVAPWADFHGELPDYDHPLRCVFESGVQYAVELLAKELDVTDWQICEGTEEFDGDLGGTLMNIVRAAMPEDAYGERMWPSEVRAALTATPQAPTTILVSSRLPVEKSGLARMAEGEPIAGDQPVPEPAPHLFAPDQFAENAKCSGMEELASRLAEAAVDAANIVTNDGYYEIDIEAATRAILAALSAQSGGERWQPIETAPKDGTRILGLGHRGDQPDIVEWGSGRFLGRKQGYRQAWISQPGYEVTPTHWQPLPAAEQNPSEKEAGRG